MRFLPHLLVPLPAKKLVRQNKHTSRSTYTTELLDEFASKVSRTTSVPFGLCSDSMGRLRHMYKSLLNNMRHQVCSVFTKRNTQHAPKPFYWSWVAPSPVLRPSRLHDRPHITYRLPGRYSQPSVRSFPAMSARTAWTAIGLMTNDTPSAHAAAMDRASLDYVRQNKTSIRP